MIDIDVAKRTTVFIHKTNASKLKYKAKIGAMSRRKPARIDGPGNTGWNVARCTERQHQLGRTSSSGM